MDSVISHQSSIETTEKREERQERQSKRPRRLDLFAWGGKERKSRLQRRLEYVHVPTQTRVWIHDDQEEKAIAAVAVPTGETHKKATNQLANILLIIIIIIDRSCRGENCNQVQ